MTTDDLGAFLRRAWRVHLDTAAYKLASVQRLGLTPHDVHAIATLADFGPMSASELADRLGVTGGAVTGIVDRLIAAKVARREVVPRDRRRRTIVLQRSALDDLFDDLTAPALQGLATYSEEDLRVIARYYDDLDRLLHRADEGKRRP